MDLKTKHRLEKNIVGNRAALFLTTFTVIISLLNLVAGVTVSGLIRIAICFAIIGFNLVTFSKYKVEEIYIQKYVIALRLNTEKTLWLKTR